MEKKEETIDTLTILAFEKLFEDKKHTKLRYLSQTFLCSSLTWSLLKIYGALEKKESQEFIAVSSAAHCQILLG